MINRIEKLLEGITPGPWTCINDVIMGTPTEAGVYASEKDMVLMEAAPTIIRELHEHAQKLREVLEYAHSQMQPFCDDAKVKGVLAAYDAWMKGELDD